MDYRTYSAYKNSRIFWIGEIPSHWDCKKAFQIISGIGSGATPLRSEDKNFNKPQTNWLLSGELNDEVIELCNNRISEHAITSHRNLKIYPNNSVAIAMYGTTIGRTSLIKFSTTVNQACCVFPPSNSIYPKYLFYFLISSRPFLFSNAEGSGQLNININTLKSLPILIPKYKEQLLISDYLDKKIENINKLITKQKVLISLLKEQLDALINRSVLNGIERISEFKSTHLDSLTMIPSHWNSSPIKYICQLYGRIGFRGYSTHDIVDPGYGVLSISPSNISNNELDLHKKTYINWSKYYQSPEIQVYNKDILMVKTASIGKVCIVDELSEPATINPQMLIFKDIKINHQYLFYLLSSYYIQSLLVKYSKSSTLPSINQETLGALIIPIPSIKEQKNISSYLSLQSHRVTSSIKLIQENIRLLLEKKNILIHNVVTGKVHV